MKTPATLREVRARLEEAVSLLPGSTGSPQDRYNQYEEVAIAILDSEHSEFPPGLLEAYLQTYLHLTAMEMGVPQSPAADT